MHFFLCLTGAPRGMSTRPWHCKERAADECIPTPSEALESITGFGAYCARVEIYAREGFVLHHVEVDRVPNSVGITRKRWFEFRGDNVLVLRPDSSELPSGRIGTSLVWHRVKE